MATREENLKKINAELEKLTDEELENVAGGIQPQNEKWPPKKAISATDSTQPDNDVSDKSIHMFRW